MNNGNDGCTTQFYDRQIPAFAESALEALYGALYSSLPQLSLSDIRGVGTYAASERGNLRALFLHLIKGRELRVVNEGMSIVRADAEAFATEVFTREPEVDRIRFHAVRVTGGPLMWPSRQAPVTEDIVIDLPGDQAAYMASLGKSTRKTLRQNMARAGDLLHAIVPGDEAGAGLVDTIIGFNHARMTGKRRASALDARASAQLMSLVRARGMVGTVSMHGRLCAGTLACRIGDDVYSLVNAHDPAFDHWGMGNISRHLMILAAIRAHARRFHLLGGHFASKRSSGAQRIRLDELRIYRSRRAMLADTAGAIAMALRSADYRLRAALDDVEPPRPAAAKPFAAGSGIRLMKDAVQALRRLKTAQR